MWFRIVTKGFIFSKSFAIEAASEDRAREQAGRTCKVHSVSPLPLQHFVYEAMEKTGREVKGRMSAHCEEDVQKQLRAKGFYATKIKLRKDKRKA
jgi:hypothetical protein